MYPICAVFIFCTFWTCHENEAQIVSRAIRDRLLLKSTSTIFRAEYKTQLPAAPRIASGKESRLFIIDGKNSYYSKWERDSTKSSILLADKQLYWMYEENGVERLFVKSPYDVDAKSIEQSLSDKGFVFNTYRSYDVDLLAVIDEMLKAAKYIRKESKLSATSYYFQVNEIGEVEFGISENEVKIIKPSAEGEQTIFSYRYQSTLNADNQHPKKQLLIEFEKNVGDIMQSTQKALDMWDFLAQKAAQSRMPRSLNPFETLQYARRYSLLLPTKTGVRIIRSIVVFNEMSLEVVLDNHKRYFISQFLPNTARITEADLKYGTIGSRKYKDYKVVKLREPGNTKAEYLYYLKDNLCLFVPTTEFNDRDLDLIIDSFKKVDAERK